MRAPSGVDAAGARDKQRTGREVARSVEFRYGSSWSRSGLGLSCNLDGFRPSDQLGLARFAGFPCPCPASNYSPHVSAPPDGFADASCSAFR
jgi:hypothetical protein